MVGRGSTIRCGAVTTRGGAAAARALITSSAHTYNKRRPPSAALTYHATRSGGTTPMSSVRPMASSRKTKMRRRRARARACRRSRGPRKRTPLRGVTIQRPVVPCTSAFATSSILRSKSSTLRLSDRLRPIGMRNAAHMMTKTPSSNHCMGQPPVRRSPDATQHLGWTGTVAPHVVPEKHIDVIFPSMWKSCGKGLPTPVTARSLRVCDERAALAAGLRQQADALDPRAAVEGLRGVVQRERRCRDAGERLHLDAGAIDRAHRDDDVDPAVVFRFDRD